ncbi:MAG: carboxypeptidase-like regulatory domain-containing protein [Bacteroidales bacterium]|nr:carboxypeptidase-like regulatory domain-containing protein [Bacteroidales bacterium]
MKAKILLFIFLIIGARMFAQTPPVITQTIRGVVLDNDSKVSLPGANVLILNSSPAIGTATDSDGKFMLKNVPLGRQSIQVSYIGYETVVVSNLILNSAQEIVLEVGLTESNAEQGSSYNSQCKKG